MNLEVHSIGIDDYKEWLLKKHYAKRLCSVTYAFGLFDENNVLVGVITFGMSPSSTLAQSICGERFKSLCFRIE